MSRHFLGESVDALRLTTIDKGKLTLRVDGAFYTLQRDFDGLYLNEDCLWQESAKLLHRETVEGYLNECGIDSGDIIPRTSADEAVALQEAIDKALDEQRERIAASLERVAHTYADGDYDATLLDIAALIRSGEIGEYK